MPLPVVTDHYLVSAQFLRVGGDPVMNTFCFRNDDEGAGRAAVADHLRDLLDTFYGDGMAGSDTAGAVLANTLHSLTYVIYDLGDPDAGALERSSLTYRTEGSTASAQAPPDLAMVISWRTDQRGQSFRGRTFIGPLEGSVVGDDGRPITVALEALAGAAPLLIGNPLTRVATLCVLSRTRGIATPVTGGYVDNAFDTQRRRDGGPTARVSFGALS